MPPALSHAPGGDGRSRQITGLRGKLLQSVHCCGGKKEEEKEGLLPGSPRGPGEPTGESPALHLDAGTQGGGATAGRCSASNVKVRVTNGKSCVDCKKGQCSVLPGSPRGPGEPWGSTGVPA